LGSNSFRLEIGRFEDGQINHTEYLKETVRQGNGLDANRNLTPEAMQRGWECLARFGERLAGFKKNQVRAVATQTLREANNRDEFLSRAHQILGFPIDVIAGREEARLIYQGVAHLLPQSTERRLVIDIGGRSTEMILGCGLDAKSMESWRVGSVAWSMKYFPDGLLSARAFNSAEIAAKAVLDEAIQTFGSPHWDTAYGSSGTVGAVSDVLAAAGWPADVVTRDGLDWLLERLIKAQSADRLKMEGLKDDRRAVIGGGVSVLRAVFDLLDIDTLHTAQGALRHGALYDLLDREETQTDLRSRTVRGLTRKFHVDLAHAERVSRIASQLLSMMHQGPADELERFQQKLDWAAQLHEIGSHISHNEPHKHGAYILHNADAPGFALPELHRLSLLVLGHRGKLRKLEADFSDSVFIQQLMALRLAVIFCHARREPDLKGLRLTLEGSLFSLLCRKGWSEAFPQSAYLLREESMAWEKTLCTLTIKDA
jgi:exopolyphosphatase/guanosine-5'-triphosphate,3'-diphosphate pyrophosphatase